MFGRKITALDRLFSKYIRMRDGWRCQICQTDYSHNHALLDCAHCFSAGTHQTRYEPDNAVAACKSCHQFSPEALDKNVIHIKYPFFKKRIGDERFDLLSWKFHNPGKFQKIDKVAVKLHLETLIKELEDQEEVYGRR
jgi:hypothetical protein